MACLKCKINPVWKFTNQIQLCSNCFTNYFERKVFRTIRKYHLLPKNKIIILKKSNDLNTKVLKFIIEKKFHVKFGKPNLSSENLSQTAEKIFSNIIKGNFNFKIKQNAPLLYLSDGEIELYAKLRKIKGIKRKPNKNIQKLFSQFTKKNPDLEHNIINTFCQL